MDRLGLMVTVGAALLGIGQTQLKDPPRGFIRITNYNCLLYPHAFRCVADGSCIPPERVRDGTRDCLDGSDENPSMANVCDYAPFFADYRCSVYADCIDLSEYGGYACRCKHGYVGAGEVCQPALLNLPRFLTSPMPLVIQTRRNQSNGTTPSLLDLSQQVLEKSSPDSKFASVEEAIGGTSLIGAMDNGDRLVIGRRELRNESLPTTTDTTLGTEGYRVVIPDNIVCPPYTIIINESGQIWCLRLNGGKLKSLSGYNVSNSRFLPYIRPTGEPVTNLTTDSATGLAKKIAAILEANLAGGEQNSVIDPVRNDNVNGSSRIQRNSIPASDNIVLSQQSNPDDTSGQMERGVQGSTPTGAVFGYMATSANSRQPGYLVPLLPATGPFVQGTIISPVKIWNATGGAITAYRVLPNGTLPASCIGVQTMFLCADRTECVPPSRILDGHEDCRDGSDEVPEFIDECALGEQWPQYACGSHARCTDERLGYTCDCDLGYVWNGSTCATDDGSNSLGGSAVGSTVASFPYDPASASTFAPASMPPPVNGVPTSVRIVSHPGFGTWTSNTGTSGAFPKSVLQFPLATFRRPTTMCTDCVSPDLVTLGPAEPGGQAQQDGGNAGIPGSGTNAVRVPQTYGSPRVTTFIPANDQLGRVRSEELSSPSTQTPGVTITGTYDPSSSSGSPASASGRGGPFGAVYRGSVDSNYVGPDGSSYPRFTTSRPSFNSASSGSNSDWPAVLAALASRRTSPPDVTVPTATSFSTGEPDTTPPVGINTPDTGESTTGGVGNISVVNLGGTGGAGPDVGGHLSGIGLTSQPFHFGSFSSGTTSGPSAAAVETSTRDTWSLPTVGPYRVFSGGRTPSYVTAVNQAVSGPYNSAGQTGTPVTPLITGSTGAYTTVINPSSINTGGQQGVMVSSSARSYGGSSALGVNSDSTAATTASATTAPTGTYMYGPVTALGSQPSAAGKSDTGVQSPATGSSTANGGGVTPSAFSGSASTTRNPVLSSSFGGSGPVLVPFNGTTTLTSAPAGSQGSQAGSAGIVPTVSSQPDPLKDMAPFNSATATANSVNPSTDSPPASAIIVPYGSGRMTPSTGTFTGSPSDSTLPAALGTTAVPVNGFSSLVPVDSTRTASTVQVPNASTQPTVQVSTASLPPNPFPTDIFWNVSTRRQQTEPQAVSGGSGDTGSGAGGSAITAQPNLRQTNSCFGNLFQTAYAALQANSRNCQGGCNGTFESCITPPGRCECRTGWSRSGPNRECQSALQYNMEVTFDQLCGQPLNFAQYMSDLSNPSTQQLAVVVCYQMEQLILQSAAADHYSPGSCHPNGFSAGSVKSSLGLSFSAVNASSRFAYDLAFALGAILSANNGSMMVDGSGFHVKPEVRKNANGSDILPPDVFNVFVSDVLECDLKISTCSPSATCDNTFGSYNCICKPGFVDLNPTIPGRTCTPAIAANDTSYMSSNASWFCPKEYYRSLPLINPCLHPAYFILLIIAFVIAGIIVLAVIGSLIACCCRCCNRKRAVLEAPQVALIRAAARSPRPSAHEHSSGAANVNYQVLHSVDKGDRLEPRATPPPPAPGPYSALNNSFDVEKGAGTSNSDAMMATGSGAEDKRMSDDVQTWEEVEVPTYASKEEDAVSKRALSPSQGSTRSRTEKLGPIISSEILEETVTTAEVQRSQPRELAVPKIQQDGISIGSSSDIQRTEYILPPSPSQSMKGLTAAMQISKKFHLQAQGHLRKASAETREWQVPRTESLVVEDDGLDVDTLPHTDYAKEPVYELSSPIPDTDISFDEKDLILKRLGVGNRDSFDDVMDQTKRFYQESSSDVEYEKEGDLPVTSIAEVKKEMGKEDDDGSKANGTTEHKPAFPMLVRPDSVIKDDVPEEPGPRRVDSQDEDDHQSLKSTDEDELVGLRGSIASLKSPKLDREISHDSVIDEMVDDQTAFYSPTNNSDDEEYLQRKPSVSIGPAKDFMTVPQEPERKTSAIQRDIAINEFDALGERDSIDDFLDHTHAFFSRASTLESFQLNKSESSEESGLKSRKSSQNMLSVELNGSDDPNHPSPRQRRPLLKKRSAFHSRDSMSKIIETTGASEGGRSSSEQAPEQSAPPVELKTESQEPDDQPTLDREASREANSSSQRLALDDDDVNDFFNPNAVSDTRRDSETGQLETSVESSKGKETLEEQVEQKQVKNENEKELSSRRRSSTHSVPAPNWELLDETVTSFDPDLPRKDSVNSQSQAQNPEDKRSPRNLKSDDQPADEGSNVERIEDLDRPPSRGDTPDMAAHHTIRVTPPGDEAERSGSPRESEVPRTAGLTRPGSNRQGDDAKSVKSVSDQNLQVGEVDGAGQPIIPHDSDSGVYVETVHAAGSSAGRQANVMSSQDDLHVFEGQEARREGSGSSYQRLSQSDDEEEIMKRYSTEFEKKIRKTKRIRQNYEMGPPESRHVYYSTRPKKMPPTIDSNSSTIWKDSTWWRVRK